MPFKREDLRLGRVREEEEEAGERKWTRCKRFFESEGYGYSQFHTIYIPISPSQLAVQDSETLKKTTAEKRKKSGKALAMAAQFPDLTVSSAEERRRRVFWQMPFRHQLYRQNAPAIQR